MSQSKTRCKVCGIEIFQTTAYKTGGLCMPCKNGTKKFKSTDSTELLEVSCYVKSDSGVDAKPIFFIAAEKLLEELLKIGYIGTSEHANRFEVEAQCALLRHAIHHKVKFQLHDDHWARTSCAVIKLFENGIGRMELNGKSYIFSDVVKEEWQEGDEPLGSRGGFLYKDAEEVVLKRWTWIS
jgi:hypothetical protein